ncbi:hypothetical protein AVEN_154984-1 [Araneus ventricosus]|uniref:Uncharacterized protein n=1 Tax=Araneus ventricosus TaxID=182803 RepID=A0A4Y2A766_ARAVE|nr:hypothetical protein AVEN_154984-1 [Araneus ventricosus]
MFAKLPRIENVNYDCAEKVGRLHSTVTEAYAHIVQQVIQQWLVTSQDDWLCSLSCFTAYTFFRIRNPQCRYNEFTTDIHERRAAIVSCL